MKKILIIITIISKESPEQPVSNDKTASSSNFKGNNNAFDRYLNNKPNSDNQNNLRNSSNFSMKNSTNEKNLIELQKKGLEIIENQSFWVELEKWGKVKFISGRFHDHSIRFYLVNEKEKILYSFPRFYGSEFWFFWELRAVSFKDVDKDGLKDIIIADYVTGAGAEGAIPFPVCSIYFQKEKQFNNLPALDEEINLAHKNKSVDMVLRFMEGKVVKFGK